MRDTLNFAPAKNLPVARTEQLMNLHEYQAKALFKRFDIPDLNVIKISLPRPVVQGHIHDRDMHGAAWASVIAEMDIN